MDGRLTHIGSHGRIWPHPRKPKRKRFRAWFERDRDIRVKFFPTRKAAADWLTLLEAHK